MERFKILLNYSRISIVKQIWLNLNHDILMILNIAPLAILQF